MAKAEIKFGELGGSKVVSETYITPPNDGKVNCGFKPSYVMVAGTTTLNAQVVTFIGVYNKDKSKTTYWQCYDYNNTITESDNALGAGSVQLNLNDNGFSFSPTVFSKVSYLAIS